MSGEEDAKATAKRLARIWEGAAARTLGHGVGEREIALSMISVGLMHWLKADDVETVAAGLAEITHSMFSTGNGKH